MLSYRHAFHAGNHADILKHTVLVNILESLCKKEKPFTVFDTHAASGLYSLDDERSLKTNEANDGIITLLRAMDEIDFPETLSNYYKIVSLYKAHSSYPGSVEFEKIFLDEQCAHIVSELNNSEIDLLKENAKTAPRVFINKTKTQVKTQIHHRDGLEAILALTPPQIKRGLCLIDPSYEEKDDYKQIEQTVVKLSKKWNVGIIAVWYPLLSHRAIEIEQMKNSIIASVKAQDSNTQILDARLLVNKSDSHTETSLKELKENPDSKNPPRLYGSGMLIVRSPWQLDTITKDNLSYISQRIYKNGCPSYEVNVY
ncbi:23S rRNA (adenine(2030)-N(6))-methyltransferase RlmJ [Treponema sp.]|uniref:23S rRNA (adenine(2030)-N(6))-methyltransferase RlmJ n=1 Tax=Treponema sp. TaxID=166 RepID=UPI00298DA9E6|nr:23S rRNA (adenine(2030)-N(6))-methyltransferase RlmJ [Treponema sp.]MCR5614404.1 23S rRNA (adenine(2030)-N(6))-methyltransferase RlmJ [Treponema sp.]